jgi:hypothetical protein
MKTYIAICETYCGENKTVWLHDCADFWAAVNKARELVQLPAPLPVEPDFSEVDEHLRDVARWTHQDNLNKVKWINEKLIKEVLEIKRWMA